MQRLLSRLLSHQTGKLMPGQIRPIEKLVKIVNKILEKPKDKQQKNENRPSDKRIEAWRIDSYSITPR